MHRDTPFPRTLPYGLVLLYEDRDLLVVDKPAGILSIARDGGRERSVYSILDAYLHKKGERRSPAMVHRLDKDTSGVMLLVKSAALKELFMGHWKEQIQKRSYIARVEGTLPAAEGIIDAPLAEDRFGRVHVVDASQPGARPAVTRWRLIRAEGAASSLVAVELDTGRHNQIRVHFAHINHPVVGDKKYGHGGSGRLYLHAETLDFRHPQDGRLMEFTSPVPWIK
jgi:23S rRNA pseudouridine1911/1915/1917 synthase